MAWSEIQSVLCGPSTVSVESLDCFPNCYSLVRLSTPNSVFPVMDNGRNLCSISVSYQLLFSPWNPQNLNWTCTVQGSAKDWRIISTHISGFPLCDSLLARIFSSLFSHCCCKLLSVISPLMTPTLCKLTEALQVWSSDHQHLPHVETG